MDKLNMGSGTVKYPELKDAITLDIDPELNPDVVWDLNIAGTFRVLEFWRKKKILPS